ILDTDALVSKRGWDAAEDDSREDEDDGGLHGNGCVKYENVKGIPSLSSG
ncbi:hypothetical protein V498_01336, partial [Pseudogymnoascus sp. VKM F-4517 (FW-2822)]